jgi:AraC-like DNA-binding protein
MNGGSANGHELFALRRALWDVAERAQRAITQLDAYVNAQPNARTSGAAEASSHSPGDHDEPARSPPPLVFGPGLPMRTVPPLGQSRGVTRALRHIEMHFDRPIALARLARIAGCSRSTLARAFRREVGLTPHEYLVGLRLARAACGMTTGDKIESVMLDAGFRSKRNFYRLFKAQFGRTPAQHRGEPEQ